MKSLPNDVPLSVVLSLLDMIVVKVDPHATGSWQCLGITSWTSGFLPGEWVVRQGGVGSPAGPQDSYQVGRVCVGGDVSREYVTGASMSYVTCSFAA